MFQFFTGGAQYIGLKNFDTLVHDPLFWKATYRNVFFMVGCVFFTVVPGVLIALLFTKISNWARLLLTTGLVFAWSMPALVYVNIFEFTTDRNFGVFNYIFYKLGIQHEPRPQVDGQHLAGLRALHRHDRLGLDPVRRDHRSTQRSRRSRRSCSRRRPSTARAAGARSGRSRSRC